MTLQPADEDQGKPMGVDYCVRTYVAEQEEQKSHKRSSVTLAIKKVGNTYLPTFKRRLPCTVPLLYILSLVSEASEVLVLHYWKNLLSSVQSLDSGCMYVCTHSRTGRLFNES